MTRTLKTVGLTLAAAGYAIGAAGSASAQSGTTIFDARGIESPFNTVRSAGIAPLGLVTFNAPTTIGSFGVYDAMSGAGTQTFLIFNESTGALLYQSAAKAFAGDGNTGISFDSYKMSDDFLFTFLPGVQYAIGATSNVTTGYFAAFDSVSENGITVAAANDNVNGTTIQRASACCSTGLRFVAPAVASAVPEAATWAMMMTGLGVVGASLRRRRAVNTRVSFA